jgi:putative ABC transport system permease protein
MNHIAIRMLVGDRAKYLGIVMGLTFASLLITQQMAIFVGLISRTYTTITDCGIPDIWVSDPQAQFIDDIKPMQDTELLRIRGIDGVQWAMPFYKGLVRARLENGGFQATTLLGLDDATLVGGPPEMVQGELADLRTEEGIIIDEVGATDKFARAMPDGTKVPLKVGDTMELNDHRAVVVGICRYGKTWSSLPIIYTTYSRALLFAPQERQMLSFVLVKCQPGQAVSAVCDRIHRATGLGAYAHADFLRKTRDYFLERTGIPINFGIAVALGFVVGTAVAGQTFYNFTLENLRYFGTLKAMGASNPLLVRMIVLQAGMVGFIGYGLGVGITAVFGWANGDGELAFVLPWWLLAFTAAAILLICVLAALISLVKVMRLEPAIVFKG